MPVLIGASLKFTAQKFYPQGDGGHPAFRNDSDEAGKNRRVDVVFYVVAVIRISQENLQWQWGRFVQNLLRLKKEKLPVKMKLYLALNAFIIGVLLPVYTIVAVLQGVGDDIHLCPQWLSSLCYDTRDLLNLGKLHLKPLVHVTVLWERHTQTGLMWRLTLEIWNKVEQRQNAHPVLSGLNSIPWPAMHWWCLVCSGVQVQVSRVLSTSWKLWSLPWCDGPLSLHSPSLKAPSSLQKKNHWIWTLTRPNSWHWRFESLLRRSAWMCSCVRAHVTAAALLRPRDSGAPARKSETISARRSWRRRKQSPNEHFHR